MIHLDTATKSLEVKLAGAVSTTELPYVCSYVDVDQLTLGVLTAPSTDGTTNGGTAVVVAAAPGANITRKINFLSVFNADLLPAIVTVQLNNNGTKRICWKGTLAVGDTLTYTS